MSSCGNASVIGGRAGKAPAPATARFRRQTQRGLSSGGWLCKLTRLPTCLALAVAVMALATVTAPGQEADADADSGSSGLIAFIFLLEREENIHLINTDGSGLTRDTDDPVGDRTSVWSPDGTRIAFLSVRDGFDEIYVMNGDGSGIMPLTIDSRRKLSPKWIDTAAE